MFLYSKKLFDCRHQKKKKNRANIRNVQISGTCKYPERANIRNVQLSGDYCICIVHYYPTTCVSEIRMLYLLQKNLKFRDPLSILFTVYPIRQYIVGIAQSRLANARNA